MDLTRRKLFSGLGLLIAAPAIVRASSLMPVRSFRFDEGQQFSIDLRPGALNYIYDNAEIRKALGIHTIRARNVILHAPSFAGQQVRTFRGVPIIFS